MVTPHTLTFVMSRIRNMKSKRETITFDSIKAKMPEHTPLRECIDQLVADGKLSEREVTLTVFDVS